MKFSITSITVVGASGLLTLAVAVALILGFGQAAKSTRQLWADQSDTLMSTIEVTLESRLRPVADASRNVATKITQLGTMSGYDSYMYGILDSLPHVAGVAIIRDDAVMRRWSVQPNSATTEDWSNRPNVVEWLATMAQATSDSWQEPVWVSEPLNSSMLLHATPLRSLDGGFLGVFAQIVPIRYLSNLIGGIPVSTGMTPFVLYDRDYVLAHPMLVNESFLDSSEQRLLPTVEELGDLVLDRMRTPDDDELGISEVTDDTRAVGANWGGSYYVYLTRDIEGYGPSVWTIGVYLNTSLYEDNDIASIFRSLAAGLITLLIAIFISIVLGRRVSKPIKAIAAAASKAQDGHLEHVPHIRSSRIRELDDAAIAFNNMVDGLTEREVIRETLGRFVPEEVATSLLASGGSIAPTQAEATILFCDIEAFTRLTETLGPVKTVEVLNDYFSAMVEILERHDGVVTQFQGDAVLATFNVPIENQKHADNAILAAIEMLEKVANTRFFEQTINIRIGLNTGAVVAGAVGAQGRQSYTVHGDAVNLASRLESLNKQHGTRVLISDTTVDRSRLDNFHKVGSTEIRGQSRPVMLYTVNTDQSV